MKRISVLISIHCAQNCMELRVGASDKDKNDVTSGKPVNPKLTENVCYYI